MASSLIYFILVILAIFAPTIFAADFVVGDDKGWTINVDYQAWAQGKQFYVGDNLGKLVTSFFPSSLLS